MSNNQRLHFSTTDHPVLFSSITNNDNNESDVRSNSNVNEEVYEDRSSSCSSNNSRMDGKSYDIFGEMSTVYTRKFYLITQSQATMNPNL